MFRAWYVPFFEYGVLHGDPHLGNYTVRADGGLNLLDFGCIRVFPPALVAAVIDLYHAVRTGDAALAEHAYRTWRFQNLSPRGHRRAQRLGAVRLRAAARGQAPDARRADRRHPRPRDRRARDRRAAPGGRRRHPARVRDHGPRRDRAWRRVPAAPVRGQLAPPVQRRDRHASTPPPSLAARPSCSRATASRCRRSGPLVIAAPAGFTQHQRRPARQGAPDDRLQGGFYCASPP